MYGESKPDVIVRVPVGTIIKDTKTGDVLADLNENDMEAIICKGGKGVSIVVIACVVLLLLECV